MVLLSKPAAVAHSILRQIASNWNLRCRLHFCFLVRKKSARMNNARILLRLHELQQPSRLHRGILECVCDGAAENKPLNIQGPVVLHCYHIQGVSLTKRSRTSNRLLHGNGAKRFRFISISCLMRKILYIWAWRLD
jgi:hypothetical protein